MLSKLGFGSFATAFLVDLLSIVSWLRYDALHAGSSTRPIFFFATAGLALVLVLIGALSTARSGFERIDGTAGFALGVAPAAHILALVAASYFRTPQLVTMVLGLTLSASALGAWAAGPRHALRTLQGI